MDGARRRAVGKFGRELTEDFCMTTQYVTGASPVSYISENPSGNVGKQYQIPIALLTVTNGQPDASAWISALGIGDPDKTVVTSLIANLTALGVLQVVTSP
jgi:hypothetical protein